MGKIKRRELPGAAARQMPLKNAEGAKDSYSAAASTIVRQLSLGGIALVWIIKIGKPEAGGIAWSHDLMLPLALFALALVADLFQYVWGALAWSIFFASCEKQGKGLDDLVSAPSWINTPTAVFFVSKVASILIGYVLLLVYMFNALIR